MSSDRSSPESPCLSPETRRPSAYPNGPGAGVLLVEDDPGYAALVRTMIEDASLAELGFEQVERLGDACDYLREAGAGCVLLDLSLPDAGGLEGVARLRTADPDIPIVVLTGLADDGLAVDAIASGAQDYLLKGKIDGYQLAHAVRFAIERQRRERAPRKDQPHDPLTDDRWLPSEMQFAALRSDIDSSLDSGLALEEIEIVLEEKPLPEEIRDAAWLYAWSVLQASGRRPRAR